MLLLSFGGRGTVIRPNRWIWESLYMAPWSLLGFALVLATLAYVLLQEPALAAFVAATLATAFALLGLAWLRYARRARRL